MSKEYLHLHIVGLEESLVIVVVQQVVQQVEMHDERNVSRVVNHPPGLADAEQVFNVEERGPILVTNGNFVY